MNIRQLIPKSLRQEVRVLHRRFKDIWNGDDPKYARPGVDFSSFGFSMDIVQPIRPNHLYENKIDNIRLAADKINTVIIDSGALFSFWRIVGKPSKWNGYKKGRNVIGGSLEEDFGGGLCQLSGILYHLTLQAGLEIIERHNHSVDLYTDETRFTPLGTDAAVAYGYKDLRFHNTYPFPIRFIIDILEDQLIASLWSASSIQKATLSFERKESDRSIEVIGWNDKGKPINHSRYNKTFNRSPV